jgi:hypothetical protein
MNAVINPVITAQDAEKLSIIEHAQINPPIAQVEKATAKRVHRVAKARKLKDHVTFEGAEMTRKQANQLMADRDAAALKLAKEQPKFLDPQDFVDTFVSDLKLRARVRSSLAWTVDSACINAARNIFYRIREFQMSNGTDFDKLSDYVSLVADMKANEDWRDSLGYERNTGDFQQLAMLLNIRHYWHDLAAKAATSAGVSYKPKTLDELLLAEKAREMNVATRTNFETAAKFATRKSPDNFEKVLAAMHAGFKAQSQNRAETNKLTEPAVRNIFSLVEAIDDREVGFYELPVRNQLSVMRALVSATQRAMNDLASSANPIEYAGICAEGFELIDATDPIIAGLVAQNES